LAISFAKYFSEKQDQGREGMMTGRGRNGEIQKGGNWGEKGKRGWGGVIFDQHNRDG